MISDRCPVRRVLSVLSVCDVGVLWPNGCVDQDETWHAGRPRPWHVALDGDPAPPPPKEHSSPQSSAHICYDQMAGWIKMPLGREVGLSPGDFVLDGDPAPHSPKRGRAPSFGSCLLWPNGWMDQDGTWHGGRPRSRPHCARWGPSCPSAKKGQSPNFRPMSIVVKRLDGSTCHFVRG